MDNRRYINALLHITLTIEQMRFQALFEGGEIGDLTSLRQKRVPDNRTLKT